MPFAVQHYPKWAVVLVRTLRVFAYAFASVTGVAAVVFTPASITPVSVVLIASMAIFGSVCLIGTIWQKYVVEWISLFFLAGGISVYVIGLWVSALSNARYVTAASVMTMLVLLLIVRIVDLTVYWLKMVKVAVISKEMADDE